jgi:hypothetical protein
MFECLWFFIGFFFFGILWLLWNIFNPPVYSETWGGNLQYKIVCLSTKLLGLQRVYDNKLRALRCLELSCALAVKSGLPIYAAQTMLSLQYSNPAGEPVEDLLGKLAVATVLAAHVLNVKLGTEVVQRIAKMEE